VTLFALVVKMALPVADAVQLIPTLEYAIVFVPEPAAIQREPVQATLLPCVENTVELMAVQVIPSAEYAIELVP
jgi:hypothetical protein